MHAADGQSAGAAHSGDGLPTLEAFTAQAKSQGFDQVLERVWAPGQVVGSHSHPFDASALVVKGEFWLSCGDNTRHLRVGDRFELARNTPHDERYGPEGAVFWVARRNASSS